MDQTKYDINEVSDHVAMLQRAGTSDDLIEEFLGKAGWTLPEYIAQVNRLNEAGGSFKKSGPVMGAANAFQQGATLGFADEVQGAGQALYDIATGPADLADFPNLYRQSRAKADLAQADFSRENPNAAALAAGTGAALPAVVPGGPLMRSGVSALQRVGGSMWTGGAAGAAAGAGSAQPGERVGAAQVGAVEGAALGGLFGGAVEGVGALKAPVMELADYVMGVVRGRRAPAGSPAGGAGGPQGPRSLPMAGTPTRAAAAKAEEAMAADSTDPLALLGALQEGRAGGTPMSIAEVAGPTMQGAARATVTMPGQGRALAEAGLNPSARPSAQRGRLEAQLEGLAGRPIPTPDELVTDIQARKQRRRGDYRALSNQQGPVADEALVASLEGKPIYREAWERENASRTRTGEELPPLFDGQGRLVRSPTVEDFQAIKTQLDAEVYGAEGILTPETARAKAAVSRVEGARRELVEQADRAVPDYKTVRAAAGEDFEVERAAELAKDISRLSPQEVRDFLRGASADAAATFRAQAMLALRDKMLVDSDRGVSPALVRDLWGSGDGKMAAVMREAFGGDAAKLSEFRAAMERELTKVRARNFMFGGSNTANKLAEVADLQGGGEFGEVATQLAWGGTNVAATGAFARWMGRQANRAQAGTFRATRDELARNVFTDNIDQAEEFLRLIDQVRREREASMRVGGASAVASGVVGAQSARPQAGP